MSRRRLRPVMDAETLRTTYPVPHDHSIYGRGHDLRVKLTVTLALSFAVSDGWETVGDLSCGNGVIAGALPCRPILGDLAPGWPITGPIEKTLDEVFGLDAFILSETLEHLDDPDAVLGRLRHKTAWLVLTTPLNAWRDTNGEHYWAWDRPEVESMLRTAGFTPVAFASLDTRPFGEPYLYGMWVAR